MAQPEIFLAHISEDKERMQTVKEHLLGTAALAEVFAQPFGGCEQARLAGDLHDIGKYSREFQHRLEGGPKVDHSTAGGKEAFQLRQIEAAFAVMGHHGGLPDYGGKNDTGDTSTLYGRQQKKVPDYSAWKQEIALSPASRPSHIPPDNLSEAFYIRMLYSCLVDADYLDTEAFMDGTLPRGGYEPIASLLDKLDQYIAPWWNPQNELNRKRCDILRSCLNAGENFPNGLYTLTVPTGGGKTVSSLAFALRHAATHGKKRVIYVIPYTSIIDQTAEVFENILEAENVLEHHSGVDYTMPEEEVDPALYRRALATEHSSPPQCSFLNLSTVTFPPTAASCTTSPTALSSSTRRRPSRSATFTPASPPLVSWCSIMASQRSCAPPPSLPCSPSLPSWRPDSPCGRFARTPTRCTSFSAAPPSGRLVR